LRVRRAVAMELSALAMGMRGNYRPQARPL